jgi:phosphoribosylglycinamide formyltransferase-1
MGHVGRAGIDAMAEEFVSETIQPVVETIDVARMITGGPGLPRQFRWRSQTTEIARVLSTWRETGPCRHGSGEIYVRKHWFEVLTDSGHTMKIYFERQPRSRRNRSRWWLCTIDKSREPNVGVQDSGRGA